jgi:phosphatidylserine/phosphatidylglycerophosphate/cardiolipin synthase-like enzyme
MENRAAKRLALLLVAAAVGLLPACNWTPGVLPPMQIYFSPHGGCTDAVVQEINAAQHKIRVQAYSFTSTSIANALVEAHRRGVDVKVILDKKESREEHSVTDLLHDAGIPLSTDGIHAIAHNKIMIIDDEVVLTGSFNFTKQAEHSNAENLLVIRDRAVAAKYTDNWLEHAGHSKPYTDRDEADERPAQNQRSSHKHTDARYPIPNFHP